MAVIYRWSGGADDDARVRTVRQRARRPASWAQILAAPAFVVNLEARPDRLALSQLRIRQAGFTDSHRFPAINGWDAGELREAWQRLGNPPISGEEFGFAEEPGSQACLLSHLGLW